MPQPKKAKISEQEAKKTLEKQTGIEFEYFGVYFDEDTENWCFEVIIPNRETARRFGSLDGIHKGTDVFIVSEPMDFEPYRTLANHLQKSIFEVFDEHIWDTANYGCDWKLGTKRGAGLYCWTGEGWLEIAEIESAFLEKFGEYHKTLSMEDEKWASVKIFKNCCHGTNYKKRSPEDEWATEYECELSFNDLYGKIIRPRGFFVTESRVKKRETGDIPVPPQTETIKLTEEIKRAAEPVCAFCGTKLKETSKFCPKCGLKRIRPEERNTAAAVPPEKCPNCAFSIRATAKYCPKCGARQNRA
ncbi:MAG: zinc ribbon domain-containing protein [Treponema sp.]|nr:zinc ribbon domain-containing protein [Treponema sp.]